MNLPAHTTAAISDIFADACRADAGYRELFLSTLGTPVRQPGRVCTSPFSPLSPVTPGLKSPREAGARGRS